MEDISSKRQPFFRCAFGYRMMNKMEEFENLEERNG